MIGGPEDFDRLMRGQPPVGQRRPPKHRARMRMWRWPLGVRLLQLLGYVALVLVLAGVAAFGALWVLWLLVWWALQLVWG